MIHNAHDTCNTTYITQHMDCPQYNAHNTNSFSSVNAFTELNSVKALTELNYLSQLKLLEKIMMKKKTAWGNENVDCAKHYPNMVLDFSRHFDST